MAVGVTGLEEGGLADLCGEPERAPVVDGRWTRSAVPAGGVVGGLADLRGD